MSNELKFLYQRIKEGSISHEAAVKEFKSIRNQHGGETAASPSIRNAPIAASAGKERDPGILQREVQSALIEIASQALKVKAGDIDLHAELNDHGFDQFMLADLLDKLNQEYDLELPQTIFSGYRTLHAFMEYLLADHHEVFQKRFTPAGSQGPPVREEDRPVPGTEENLLERSTNYFREQLSSVLKLPAHRIDADAPLEKYGIDSMMVMELINQLEKSFGSLPKTLFFEYQTIRALAGYFLEAHREKLTGFLGMGEKAAATGPAPSQGSAAGTEAVLPARGRRLRRFTSLGSEPRTGKTNRALDIAVIGLSGRYPQARDIHEFWRNLRDGRDCITEIPKDRWDHGVYFDPDKNKPGKAYCKWGGFIDGVDCFDPLFFNISPREAMVMDPQERLFLECVYHTLEDAGYSREALRGSPGSGLGGRVGVYVGVMWDEYQLYGAQETLQGRPVAFTGNPSSIANRVSYFCNFHGPSMAIDTMCSSSLTAIHLACQSLQTGKCDLAIAGGVNVTIHPNKYLLLSQARFASSNGRCESFGKGGDGYVPGEGVGAVLLKPLSKAVADGDHIYGVIKAAAVNHGGKTNGFTVPNPAAQSSVIADAFREAGIDPRTISYIEAHGTGTSLGDPIEIAGLTKAFREYTQDRQFCAIGSAKSNIGHCESAAGIAAVTKVLLQMRHRQLAPSLHSRTLNPNIDFSTTPFTVQQELADWKRPILDVNGTAREYPRRAGVSSFGAGGANAHILFEEYTAGDGQASRPAASRLPALIVLSAKNEERLRKQAELLLNAVNEGQFIDPDLPAVAYTLQVGREALEERLALTAASINDLREKLQAFGEGRTGIEDLYHGRVANNTEALAGFSSADEPARTLETWINAGTYGKLLERWVKGLPLDWNRLSGGKPARISLPTYPFIRERYWAVGKAQPARSEGGATGRLLHPLLHRNTSDFSEQRFSSTFTGDEFFLRDHVVGGQRFLPGVVYLEMARAAAALAAGRNNAGVRLKNIVWARPLAVKGKPANVHIGLFPEAKGEIAYEIYTAAGGDNSEPLVHSQGSAAFIPPGELPHIDLALLRERFNGRSFDAARCYETFNIMGLEYGPAHQGIEQVYVAQGQVLARLSLPSSVSESRDSFMLHPSIMDSALQSSIGLMLEQEQKEKAEPKPVLPFALAELEVFGPCSESMWAWVRPGEGSKPGDPVQKLDIDLCDEEGNVRVRMKGFSSRVLDRGPLAKRDSSSLGAVLLEPAWKEQPLSGNPPKRYVRHLVLVCEPFTLPLSVLGGRSVQLKAEGLEADERFQRCAVRAFEEIQAILKERPAGKVLVQAILPSEGAGLLLSGLSGLLKTANLENPQLIGQVIEAAREESPESLIAKLDENSASPDDGQIRYKDGKRQVAVWNEIEFPATEAALPWRDDGVYLITGGAGGLGLIVADEISRRTKKATIVLTGRSQLSGDKQARLKAFEASGCTIVYKQMDVTAREAVAELIGELVREFGGLNGIIHAAGVIRDNFIIRKTAEEFQAVLSPKIAGLVNLDHAARDIRLDFFVLFSSAAGATGNIGQSDYAAANAFMDAYAAYRNGLASLRQRYGRTLSINWPLWKEGGMQVGPEVEKMMMRTAGIVPLQTETGIRALYQGMSSGGSRIMVLEGRPAAIRAAFLQQASAAKVPDRDAPKNDPGPVSSAGQERLQEQAVQFLKKRLSTIMRLPAHRMDADAALEKYGIDSIMIMELVSQLEQSFGSLPKTLFFEYQTIRALAGYFVASHRDSLTTLLGTPQPPAAAAPARESVVLQDQGAPVVGSRKRRRFAEDGEQRGEQPKKGPLDIAVIGLSGRYPQARDLREFWRNLRDGRDCITEIPKDRWDHGVYFDPDKNKPGKTYSKWGGFMDGVDRFDPLFFNISPVEAEAMDPQERLFLECAYHTLEDAGYTREGLGDPAGSGGKVGVYVGVMWEEYQLYGAQETIQGSPTAVSGNPSSVANRVSYFCNFHGPSMAIDTMCSSSLTAIHLACQSLQTGKCDLALAGGVSVSIHPNKYLLLARGKFVSSKGRCESFGEGGDGYVPGEGVGAVLLKPLSKAVADGDHIYGVIKAAAVNHGGKTNGFTVPNPAAQSSVIADAFREAGIDPRTISYIEAHGTGTSLGDPIEIAGLTKAFREYTQDRQFCAIGSAKSNIGHCESAAGIAGITKVLLQLKYGQVAPSLHSETLNPNIDFSATPFTVQQTLGDWKQPVLESDGTAGACPRRAGVSSFGAGGSNAHILIEEYVAGDEQAAHAAPPRLPAIIVLSAKNEERLKEYAGLLSNHLETEPSGGLPLADIAYTLQTGRESMEERIAVLASNPEELKERLKRYQEGQRDLEGVYLGNTRAGRDHNKLIFEGNVAQEFIAALARDGAAVQLAALWTSGVDVDWRLLYRDRRPKRMPLPAYPFARERYWIARTPREEREGRFVHPLIGHINLGLSLNNGIVFEKVLQQDDPLANGCRINDAAVLPGMAQIEMARAAAAQIKEGAPVGLSGVVFSHPLFLQDGGKKVRIVFKEEGRELNFTIQSNGAGPETIHSRGTITVREQRAYPDERLSLEAVKERCTERVDERSLYARLEEQGIVCGTAVRGVSALWSNHEEALASLHPARGTGAGALSWGLPPLPMEGALQAALYLAGDGARKGRPARPASLEGVDIVRPLTLNAYAYVRRSADRERFHIEVLDEAGSVCVRLTDVAFAAEDRLRNFFYAPVWREASSAEQQAPPREIREGRPGARTVLIVHPSECLGLEKALSAAHAGDRVAAIRLGARNVMHSSDDWEVRTDDPGALARCIERQEQVHIVYYLGGIQVEDIGDDDLDLLEKSQEQGVLSLFRLVKALSERGWAQDPLQLNIVTNDVHDVAGRDPVRPYAASLLGFAGSAAKEHPRWRIGRIDVGSDALREHAPSEQRSALVRRILDEAGRTRQEDVALRNGKRFVRTIEPIELPPVDRTPFRRHGVYLILGGAGGIGLELCRYLAETVQAGLVLLGRSELNDERKERLALIESSGGSVLYLQADAGDAASMQAALEKARARFGRINGVIHAAAVLKDKIIRGMDEAAFRTALASKVRGSVVLHKALRGEAIDFLMFFSSVNSFTANAGQSNYAAGCTFQDAYALSLGRKEPYPVKIVNWGYWGSVGIAASEEYNKRMQAQGILSIEPEEGMEAVKRILAHSAEQVIAVKMDDRLREALSGGRARREERQAAAATTPAGPAAAPDIKQWLRTNMSEGLHIQIDKIDDDASFDEFGVDSVSTIVLVKKVEETFGITIDPSLVVTYPTVNSLSGYLRQRLADLPGAGEEKASASEQGAAAAPEAGGPGSGNAGAAPPDKREELLVKKDQLEQSLQELLLYLGQALFAFFQARGVFRDRAPATLNDIADAMKIVPRYRYMLPVFLGVLEQNGLITLSADAASASEKALSEDVQADIGKLGSRTELLMRALPDFKPYFRLFHLCKDLYPAILSGERDGQEAFSGDEMQELARSVLRGDHRSSRALNAVISDPVRRALEQVLQRGKKQITLVDRGFGSFALGALILRLVKGKAERVVYYYADKPGLLSLLKKELGRAADPLVDFRALVEQPSPAGDVDILIVSPGEPMSAPAAGGRETEGNALIVVSKPLESVYLALTFGLLDRAWTRCVSAPEASWNGAWGPALSEAGFHVDEPFKGRVITAHRAAGEAAPEAAGGKDVAAAREGAPSGPAPAELFSYEALLQRHTVRTSAGHTLEYFTCGRGEPVVFLTALAFTRAIWKYQIEAFSDRYRLIFPHILPGHAGSLYAGKKFTFENLADDLAELLDRLGTGGVHLVGWCMAGNVAQLFNFRHPHKLKSLTLVCTTPTDARTRGLDSRDLKRYTADPLATYELEFQNIYQDGYLTDDRVREYLQIIRHSSCPVQEEAMLHHIYGVFHFDSTDRLKDISAPTLVLSGRWDIAFPPDQVVLLHKGIRHSRFSEFEMAGHMPFLNQHRLFNSLLKDFIDSNRDAG